MSPLASTVIPLGSSSSSSSEGSFVSRRPETYGAKRDGKDVWDVSMTNGSAVVTSASGLFESTIAGKSITVAGAGAAGAALSTTVLSRQSATSITLSAASSANLTNQQALWGTDDTAAINSALAAAVSACQADKTYYCELQFSAGIYVVAAATTKGGAGQGNAQIPLPAIEPATSSKITVVLRGMTDAGAWMHWLQTQGQKSGAVIRTMLVGQTPDATWKSPSVFGTNTVNLASSSQFSNVRVIVLGVTVSTPVNPSVIAMDLRRAAQADIISYSALADGTPAQVGGPTNDNGIGLYMPTGNNNDSCNVWLYGCEGFYYGMGFSDHMIAHRLGLIYCNTAIYIGGADAGTPMHGASIVYASIEACDTGIEKPNATNNQFPVKFNHVNTESVATAVKDVGNNLRGYIGWTINTGIGPDPTVTGCAHVKIENLHRLRGNITAPALPATTVASTPIFKDMLLTWAGGTVTVVSLDGVATGLTTPGSMVVPSGKSYSMTYSVAPTTRVATLL